MKEINDYLEAAFLVLPLIFFIVAVTFRLLDNSGYLLLKQEIIIDSSYVSLKILREQVSRTTDEKFKKKLKQVLLFRKLHRISLILMFFSLPVTVWTFYTFW